MPSAKSKTQILDILRAFHAITGKITEYGEDLKHLLHAILDLMVPMLNISYASILLLDEEQSHFHAVAACGSVPFTLDLGAILDISKLLEFPAQTDQRLPLTQLIVESELGGLRPEERGLLRGAFCSPLVIQEKIIGVACVYAAQFNLDTLESEEFSLCLNLAALAIEKSRLYNQIHKRLQLSREELKRTQSQLIRSEKVSSLVEIAMSVAHSIRNPVTVIGGLCRRLSRGLREDDPKRSELQMIISEASLLEGIVEEFSRFFTINQISFERADVNQLVNEAADDFSSQYPGESSFLLKRTLWNEPLNCTVDPDLLRRCLIHLFNNAREASDKSAHIEIATSRSDRDAIIDVIDYGKGMSLKVRDHAFDPFFSTKYQGTGIGLTFVHFAIKEHFGRIELKSEKGGGTRFRIYLPLESA